MKSENLTKLTCPEGHKSSLLLAGIETKLEGLRAMMQANEDY